MPYFETSAKDNINIETAFEEVSKLAFKRDQSDIVYIPKTQVNLEQGKNKQKDGGCCN
jgi:Ras-related protein Rab-7A